MRLLVVLNDLDIGGAQNYTINLINNFIKKGIQIDLKVLSDNLLLIERIDKNVDIEVWKRTGKLDTGVIKKIRNAVKTGNYGGIISSYALYQMIATCGIRKCPKTIYPVHITVMRDKKSFLFNTMIFRLKRSHEIFLTTIESQTKYLTRAHKLKKDFFPMIYNGVDTDRFIIPPDNFNINEIRNELDFDENQKIILMVAGYRPEKRHEDAFKAFVLAQMEMKNIGLLCIGDNRIKERDEYREFLEKNNIKNVVLLTSDEAGDIRKYYWVSDLFTLTSNKVETFSIAALEAMSCGLPCVLTETGGAVDIINENNGLTCAPDDAKAIADAWLTVLGRLDSYNKLKIRDYVVMNYSIHKSADEYLKLLNF